MGRIIEFNWVNWMDILIDGDIRNGVKAEFRDSVTIKVNDVVIDIDKFRMTEKGAQYRLVQVPRNEFSWFDWRFYDRYGQRWDMMACYDAHLRYA